MADPTAALDLDALAALEQAATPGRWQALASEVIDDEGHLAWTAASPNPVADAALIADLRNAAPALIAAAREVAAMRERVEALLPSIGRYKAAQRELHAVGVSYEDSGRILSDLRDRLGDDLRAALTADPTTKEPFMTDITTTRYDHEAKVWRDAATGQPVPSEPDAAWIAGATVADPTPAVLTVGEAMSLSTTPDWPSEFIVCVVERILADREAVVRADERERLVRVVGAFAAENQVWKSTAPRGPGNASYLNGFENGRRAAGDDLRDLLNTLAQPADTEEADRG